MKRLILNVLVLALFLAGLLIVTVNVSWAGQLTNDQISYLSEDPNEAEPESALANDQITYLSEDPGEPEEDYDTPE